jgi:hypothetical protein
VVTEPGENDTGTAVSYLNGEFVRWHWSVGASAVPLLQVVLAASDVEQLRDAIRAPLADAPTGLDEIPLRAFVEVADRYLRSRSSRRFAEAVFGTITEQT